MAEPKQVPAAVPANIAFIDLTAQRQRIETQVEEAVLKVIRHGQYIMGPEIFTLEKTLSEWAGCAHTVSCASGTDALALVLMAQDIKPGDAVFVPAFTFVATAEVVAWLGATPFFVDVRPDTYNMDTESLKKAIAQARQDGLNPAAIIPVDIFGQPADYPALQEIANENGLWILADAAQSFGGALDNKPVGSLALATATSFFPAKPLGCYGDGGAIFTDDAELADRLQSLRIHGKGEDKYDNVRIGMNGRLDTMQAAILLEKLKIFGDELKARDQVAKRYNEALKDDVAVPYLMPGASSAWAQYTLTLGPDQDRTRIMAACKEAGVPTMIYYPIPLSRQKAYSHYPSAPGGVPVSEDLSQRVLSLPMHPYLDAQTQDYILQTLRHALGS